MILPNSGVAKKNWWLLVDKSSCLSKFKSIIVLLCICDFITMNDFFSAFTFVVELEVMFNGLSHNFKQQFSVIKTILM